MPIEILMPALSPTMEEGTLAKWLVKEGDTVHSGDILAEIETDKATMEFEAVDEGIIGKVLIPDGSADVKVNTPIAILLEEGETADDIATTAPQTPAEAQPAAAAAEVAPAGGSDKAAPALSKDGSRVFASPLARRIAGQKGLDLSQITGSGPRGRIVKADVENATAGSTVAAGAAQTPRVQPSPAVAAGQALASGPSSDTIARMYENRDYQVVELNGMRKTIAARLTEAKQSIPHFYLRRDIQLDALLEFRSQLNKQLAARSIKLSVNDFIIKACANALQQVPEANAVWAGDKILQLTPSDVAVAVAIDGGLFTPVLQDAHHKSLSALSAEMKDLATRARDRKLAPHEYQGGSFAISNLGMFGIDNFDAVINPPHGAILAVGAGVKKPVVNSEGALAVATVMSVTLSVDHRVIDGALGAQLLQAIVENLENPMVMLA
ncbi:pyruvate dehydrogenase complex dihydrolipoamide acetyltransferase [Pelagimonas varians]|uniref:Acetyltransferase component of pyruvate dehydrogenase complex n=1 Tax=Pelagimonas varians TaxID=696760 RepID=A0A238JUD5_9RHOB|nr:pyruvate dehydrogenase complex dihydrolipoamide acetyltransferase [Pelagimonas varians]PYG34592.1 pyruvate dehydrogenase E2 component (dihydrolipoamide acetyltransferase) [Pelagimonas varians]SMX33366.1 Dihydrolipoyllysine-residue acetyltransferase component of pyruvate dehydrogenase complex [Pelagimonas varians]